MGTTARRSSATAILTMTLKSPLPLLGSGYPGIMLSFVNVLSKNDVIFFILKYFCRPVSVDIDSHIDKHVAGERLSSWPLQHLPYSEIIIVHG